MVTIYGSQAGIKRAAPGKTLQFPCNNLRTGQRRAYLTWSGDPADRPVTILDVDVVGGRLVVADSGLALPNS